jgi:NAD(P)-dependent dehydrogenase (short-subunit alcohol dehydrogenase family)
VRYEGKVAVCVGSATGMGAECARRLASEGAAVVIGDINLAAAEALASSIVADGGRAGALACNIADEASVNALIQGAADGFGGIDVMHVNAALTSSPAGDGDALTVALHEFDRRLAVGLRGHLLCTRAAIPHMQARGRGAIVYTSSNASKTAAPTAVSYYVMKAGLNALMRHVAVRWGPEGVRANAICPGVVLTDRIASAWDEQRLAHALTRTASSRLGKVEDIAALVSFLLSDEAEWINGQAISIDGGAVMIGG